MSLFRMLECSMARDFVLGNIFGGGELDVVAYQDAFSGHIQYSKAESEEIPLKKLTALSCDPEKCCYYLDQMATSSLGSDITRHSTLEEARARAANV